MKIIIALLVLAASMLVGCANPQFYKYPDYKSTVKLGVSEETISTFTETPAEDYLIPNSQVFVSGKGKAVSSNLFAVGGVVGALAAVAIDHSLNASEVDNVESNLQIKFDAELTDILKSTAFRQSHILRYEVVQTNETPDITLLPSARFVAQPDSHVGLTFRVTARARSHASGKDGDKNYYYTPIEHHAIAGEGGWADNRAALFKQTASKALSRIAQTIIEDVSGTFNAKLLPERRHIVVSGDNKSILLAEYPEYSIYMALTDNEPHSAVFQIVEHLTTR